MRFVQFALSFRDGTTAFSDHFLAAVRDGTAAPIPLDELEEVSRAAIRAAVAVSAAYGAAPVEVST
jgi:hypothetical protein